MSQEITTQDHEAYARKAVVDMATSFRKAARKTAIQNMGLVGLTFAAAAFSVLKYPDTLFPVATLGGLASLTTARRQQKQMRTAFADLITTVPPSASGIIHAEMRELEKTLNHGKLDFSLNDIDPRKHKFKMVGSMAIGIFTPAFIPAQYMIMLSGEEMQRLKAVDAHATAAIKRNTPQP